MASATDIIDLHGRHDKIQHSSKRLFENSFSSYKLFRNLTLYLFDLLHVVSIIPALYMTPFKVARASIKVFFETSDLVSHGKRIFDCNQNKDLCSKKIEKWRSREQLLQKILEGDRDILIQLKAKYEEKRNRVADRNEKISISRSNRWSEYLKLLENITVVNETTVRGGENELFNLFFARKTEKIALWTAEEENEEFMKNKAVVEVACSAAKIAVEALTIIALVLAAASGHLIVAAIVGIVCAEAIDLGKMIWCSIRNNDHPFEITAYTIESFFVMLAESKIFSDSSLLQKSFIKGFLGTYSAFNELFDHYTDIQLNQAQRIDVSGQKKKLSRRGMELLALKKASADSDWTTAEKELAKYRMKIKDAENLIESVPVEAEFVALAKAKIKKWEGYTIAYDEIIINKDNKRFIEFVDKRLSSLDGKVSNWKLNSDLCKSQSRSSEIGIVMNIVEIARFALLGIALTFALCQFSVDFLPIVFGAGVIANFFYLGYLYFATRTNHERQQIFELWDRDVTVQIAPAKITSPEDFLELPNNSMRETVYSTLNL